MQNLNLCWNEIITDDGIQHMTNMQILTLTCDKKITDNGIKHMTKMQKLHYNGNITFEGTEHMKFVDTRPTKAKFCLLVRNTRLKTSFKKKQNAAKCRS